MPYPQYGDLRVVHFFGMYALQLVPLFGYYIARQSCQVIVVAAVYFVIVTALLMQALAGRPLRAGVGN